MVKIGRHLRNISSLICSLVLTSGVLSAALSEAATYYVAKTGKDSHSCSQVQNAATPKLTIKAGIACLTAGDTLIIKAGTYSEGVVAAPSGGTAANRITIKANPGDTVVLSGGATNTLLTFATSSQSYVTVEGPGLIIDGNNLTGYAVWLENVVHVWLRNVEVRNAKMQGILSGTNANSNFLQFINVNSHHNGLNCREVGLCHGLYLSGDGHLIEGGEYHHNESHGVHLYSAPKNNTVRYVKAYNNGFTGIGIYHQSNNNVYNNLSYNNGADGIRFSSSGSTITNNTTYGNGQCGIRVSGSSDVVRNNIAFKNPGGGICNSGTNATLSNNLTTDPKFVNISALDFRLHTLSPAIDAGVNLAPVVIDDFDRLSRPQGSAYDIGAYEFGELGLAGPTDLHMVSGN